MLHCFVLSFTVKKAPEKSQTIVSAFCYSFSLYQDFFLFFTGIIFCGGQFKDILGGLHFAEMAKIHQIREI